MESEVKYVSLDVTEARISLMRGKLDEMKENISIVSMPTLDNFKNLQKLVVNASIEYEKEGYLKRLNECDIKINKYISECNKVEEKLDNIVLTLTEQQDEILNARNNINKLEFPSKDIILRQLDDIDNEIDEIINTLNNNAKTKLDFVCDEFKKRG